MSLVVVEVEAKGRRSAKADEAADISTRSPSPPVVGLYNFTPHYLQVLLVLNSR